jgi:cytochrome c oxidase subunit 4
MTEHSTASSKHYFIVYLLLMLLLGATFVLAHVNLGALGVPVALFIASLKALLVVLYFMELKHSSGLIRAAAVMGIFWLGILITLTMSDYISRNWLPLPGIWPL